ncbi:DUF1501 domain-containing protein [Methyloversatilis sp.]|uniref:DUF1501 domain-containing protein n=1 Tax=Methyloversatilis sp. TaxID=2569862 RepID=UPI002736DC86|nr:DUF1501 domain-containing protein [Methyloversatilis sp.]MDP2868326.1 DUF1501 domain-containing protein [Methyloversatilis sp.]MDP3454282.1 DUF1501 domain-containing protein [Methyloversatilis sp.]MDP3579687.1 DUF1501 domain-containing protein [Methyloversatilis sp.]
MDRRHFLQCAAAAPLAGGSIGAAEAAPCGRLLIVIDLVGGNDGLNTVIPLSDPRYTALRPTIAIDLKSCLPLDERNALHPALQPLMPLWSAGELTVVHGVGSAEASLSHHRAAELMQAALPDFPSADAAENFPESLLAHLPAQSLLAQALEQIVSGAPLQSLHLALHGFDTHERQPEVHARLLARLAATMSVLRAALQASGRWSDTLLMTRSEFGRRAAENLSAGTDHGSAGVQFIAGGRLAGGVSGAQPDLDRLDRRGNPPPQVETGRLNRDVAAWWSGAQARFVPAAAFSST